MARLKRINLGLFVVISTLFVSTTLSVARDDGSPFMNHTERRNTPFQPGKFTFVRVRYDSVGGYGESWYSFANRSWERWETDFPEADENFLLRLAELTTLNPYPKAVVRRLTDEDLHRFPMIYMCDIGWMVLTQEEKQALRRYLLQGGFLWVDDFWGWKEWESLENAMRDVFPEYEWREIPAEHPIFRMVYPLESCPQIPARIFAIQGYTTEPVWIHKSGGLEGAHLRGWFDDEGRLMAVATYNTDIGDGFEREAEGEWYFETYSTLAYAMGINIVVYAMTH